MCSLLPTVFKELYQRRPPRLCSLLWREAEADICQWDKDTATQLAGAAGMSPSMLSPGNWGSEFKPFTVTRSTSLSGQNVGQQSAYSCQEFSGNSNIFHSPYILALLQSMLKINSFGWINICKLNVLGVLLGIEASWHRNSSRWRWLQVNCFLWVVPGTCSGIIIAGTGSLCKNCSFSKLVCKHIQLCFSVHEHS